MNRIKIFWEKNSKWLPWALLALAVVWYIWLRKTDSRPDEYLKKMNDSLAAENVKASAVNEQSKKRIDELESKVSTLDEQLRNAGAQHEKVIIRYRNATAPELEGYFSDRYDKNQN